MERHEWAGVLYPTRAQLALAVVESWLYGGPPGTALEHAADTLARHTDPELAAELEADGWGAPVGLTREEALGALAAIRRGA